LDESKPEFVDNLMYAMMILSDAQEVVAQGNKEAARQYINRAKHFIDKEARQKHDTNAKLKAEFMEDEIVLKDGKLVSVSGRFLTGEWTATLEYGVLYKKGLRKNDQPAEIFEISTSSVYRDGRNRKHGKKVEKMDWEKEKEASKMNSKRSKVK
jgi:hypothetical protein